MVTILFIAFFILVIIGVPIAVSLGIASVLSILLGSHMPLLLLPQKVFNGVNSFPFMAIPLFLLAGNIMAEAKISDRLVGLASLLVGRFPGGLAHVSTGASAFLGAISGSAPATTAAIGSIMIPSMIKRNYSPAFSAAVVAASGALGLIIPPSLTMVVYGVLSGASIGSLFLCGIAPGILISLALIAMNYIIAKRKGLEAEAPVPRDQVAVIVRESILALLMPFIILGGIYAGVFTATESAAVACLYGLFIGFCVYRTLTFKALFKILESTAESAAMIMFLMGTANLFGFIITAEEVPQTLAQMIVGFTTSKVVVMFIILGMLLVLGTFLDNVAALVLFVPTIMGVINAMGINPVFFGVFTIIALAVGQFTPPVGLNLFIASNIANEKFEHVVSQTLPYLCVYLLLLTVFIFVPDLLTLFEF
ncbi:MAG TPA: TRAP transporter large permease [Candidatus Avidesulfovibrio excrementigallinarum]|nr:TRAP transporter large permease [Candidatus Avidesulfovibrio excrementigallinarum]